MQCYALIRSSKLGIFFKDLSLFSQNSHSTSEEKNCSNLKERCCCRVIRKKGNWQALSIHIVRTSLNLNVEKWKIRNECHEYCWMPMIKHTIKSKYHHFIFYHCNRNTWRISCLISFRNLSTLVDLQKLRNLTSGIKDNSKNATE